MFSIYLQTTNNMTQGTVKPVNPFDPENDCNVLMKAMKGIGTNEEALMDILCHRSNAQRQDIRQLYKTKFGKDLIHELKSELSHNFEKVMVGLAMDVAEFEASCVHHALKGAGTDEQALIDILCTKTNAEIDRVKMAYKTLFHRDMEKDIIGDTSGNFQHLIRAMCAARRQEDQPVDGDKAREDAKALLARDKEKVSLEESVLNRVLFSQSTAQLQAVLYEYLQLADCDLEDSIISETSGYYREALLALVKVARNKPAYFAERLGKCMKGAGTKDTTLIYILVTRCEVDMVQIKQEFVCQFATSLNSYIEGDTSGYYRDCLLRLSH